jgi:hypothetical protein
MFSYQKVGGLRFVKIGPFTFMFCKSSKAARARARHRKAARLLACSYRDLANGLVARERA